jgi:osmotically-inducible protein OsmY
MLEQKITNTPPDKKNPTDREIEKTVESALAWDALIPERRIRAAVSNGWVALHGKVELLREREEAERIVRRMEGVRGVYNMIEVTQTSPRAENVRDAIAGALRRYAEREADGVNLMLRGGTLNLSGRVHTWAEKQAILGALKTAPGVEAIDDRLSVDPYF